MSITVSRIKGKQYLGYQDNTKQEYDEAIQQSIDDIIEQAIEAMDNEDIASASDFTLSIERALCKQITYEFRRREDLGLTTMVSPDGTVNKYKVDEWLPDVEKIIRRKTSSKVYI